MGGRNFFLVVVLLWLYSEMVASRSVGQKHAKKSLYPPETLLVSPIFTPQPLKVILQVKVVPLGGAKTTAKPTTKPAGSKPTAGGGATTTGGTTAAPGAGGTTAAPGAGGTTAAPGAGGTTAAPGAGGTTAAPGAGGTTAAPGAGGTTAAPGAGGTTAAPGAGGTTAAPGAGGTTAAPGKSTPDLEAFRKEALQTSNNKRTIHNSPNFQLDASLNQQAQQYAEKLAAAKTPLVHSNIKGQGENLAYKCASPGVPYTGKDVVNMWYNEVGKYSFAKPGETPGTGHFTQVVWKSSTKLGMGRAKYNNGGMTCFVVVGRYTPQGNVPGYFTQNVLKGSYSG